MPIYWWMRLVPTQLLPKETDLQSAAVADLLLIHSLKQVSLILSDILPALKYGAS